MDVYREWLEIPAGPRPPTHYALLRLPPHETDVPKIHAAAAERVRQVRKYALKYPHEASKLLNEVAAAEVCLTDPLAREEYDRRLREPSASEEAAALPVGRIVPPKNVVRNPIVAPMPV